MTVAERLKARTERMPNGCLEWRGYVDQGGYGQTSIDGTVVGAHRAAWIAERGEIPAGLVVMHACDNPPCIEIEHLSLGTHADNVADMKAKGRARGAEGLSNANARLTDDEVAEIRRDYVPCFSVGRGGTRSNAKELAKRYGVSKQYVGQLVAGLWRRSA